MKTSKQISLGITLAIIGVILFSVKAVIVKLAYRYQVSSEHLLLFRMSFSLPFYIIIAMFNKPSNPQNIGKTDYIWIVF